MTGIPARSPAIGGKLPGWVGDIPTYLAFIAAALAAYFAWRTYRSDANCRAEAKTREQAERIAAWVGGVGMSVANNSGQRVYDVVATFVWVRGAASKRCEDYPEFDNSTMKVISVLPPGQWTIPVAIEGGMNMHPGAEIAFTDQRGQDWIRRATGELKELPSDPITHFQVPLPHAWDSVSPHS